MGQIFIILGMLIPGGIGIMLVEQELSYMGYDGLAVAIAGALIIVLAVLASVVAIP